MQGRQLSFQPDAFRRGPQEHGGDLNEGRRKERRPFHRTLAVHVVLRSSRAHGNWSMLRPRHRDAIDRLRARVATKHGVRIYRFANVGNHLHLLIKAPSKRAFQSFMRELPGAIASAVTGAVKGRPVALRPRPGAEAMAVRFWDRLAYTRLVTWGRDFENLSLYFIKNLFEAAGLMPKRAREEGLRVISLKGWAGPPGR